MATVLLNAAKTGGYLLDILVIVVALGFAIISARKGFIECFFSFITGFLALIAAFALAKPLLAATGGLFGIRGALENAFVKWFGKVKGFSVDISATGLQNALSDTNLPQFLINTVVDTFGNDDLAAGTTLAMLVGDSVAKMVATLLMGILIFIGVKLLLRLIKKIILSISEKISLIGAVDSLLGCVVGLLQGLFIICLVFAILSLIPSTAISSYFEKTLFVGALYHNNPLTMALGWLIG